MTKRAGKRKYRMGAQPGKPTNGQPVQKPHSLIEDGLAPRESQALEKAAILKGWLVSGEKAIQLREMLLQKLVKAAAVSDNTKEVLEIVRVIATVEQRTEQLALARDRLNKPRHSDLPQQINVGVNVNNNMQPEPATIDESPAASVADIVDAILGRADVQAALDADVPDPGYDYGM